MWKTLFVNGIVAVVTASVTLAAAVLPVRDSVYANQKDIAYIKQQSVETRQLIQEMNNSFDERQHNIASLVQKQTDLVSQLVLLVKIQQNVNSAQR